MKVRYFAVAILATLFAVAASTASGGTSRSHATKLTVWLMVDAQSGWPEAVALANRLFKAQHPDVDVDVQYQTWGAHLTKFDASLAGSNAPDVIELGNSEMSKYMAAGAFKTLKRSVFPNNKTWLQGLTTSCMYGGKLYGVPYYAGARAVIYRTDQYQAARSRALRRAWTSSSPAGSKLMKKYGKGGDYSALYFPGKNWYASMAFVYDYGGQIAVQKGGKWKGVLNSTRALAALNKVKAVFCRSRGRTRPVTKRTRSRRSSLRRAKWARSSATAGNGRTHWMRSSGIRLSRPSMGAYPMPSHTAGKFMPTFLGGSDLGIPVTTQEPEPRSRLDQGVHGHGCPERDCEGRQHRQHDETARLQRFEPEARAVCTGGEVQLVRPHEPELGERRECERASEHARQDRHRSRDREGSSQ